MKISHTSALLLLALGLTAHADDDNKASVNMWGVVDVNASYSSDVAATNKNITLGQGGMYGSRFGVNGKSATFGDGTRMIFSLEGAVDPTTGSLGGSTTFNRYAFVGMTGNLGTVRAGTLLKPYDDTAWNYEAMESMGFSIGPVTAWRGFGSTAKTIRYETPDMSGFKGSAFASLNGTKNETRWGLLGTKSFGPVDALAYYEEAKDANGQLTQTLQGWNGSTGKMFALMTRVNLGATKLYVGYNEFGAPDAADTGAAPKKQAVWSLGASYQLNTALNLKAAYYDLDNSADGSFGARTLAVGAQYALTPNATVYGLLGRISNGSSGTMDLTGATEALSAGGSQTGAKVGVVYIF